MSKADVVILIIAVIGAWGGYRQGFLMELISFAAIILGIFAAFKLMGQMMLFLEDRFHADRSILPYLSFLVVFILVLFAVRLLGRMIKNSIDHSFLGSVDQAMGAVLGGMRTLFLLSIVLWILDSLRILPSEEWAEGSWLYPFTAKLAPTIADWLGGFLPVFEEIFRQF